MKNHRSGHILVAAGLALTMGLLGACSSNASGDKPGANASSTVKSAEDATLIFAQCMRDKGFDVPDTGLTPDQLNDHSTAFDSALNECMMKVSGMTGEDNIANDPAAREAMVKAAQCLREAGYDVKDPQAGEGISVKDIPEDVLNKCFQQSGAAK